MHCYPTTKAAGDTRIEKHENKQIRDGAREKEGSAAVCLPARVCSLIVPQFEDYDEQFSPGKGDEQHQVCLDLP